jgi:hypothetical protein
MLFPFVISNNCIHLFNSIKKSYFFQNVSIIIILIIIIMHSDYINTIIT